MFAETSLWNEVEGEIVVAGQRGFDALDLNAEGDTAATIRSSGFVTSFVSGSTAEGADWVYDRADESRYRYRATPVEFDETTTVSSIDWLGSYYEQAAETDNFVVEIFESESIESAGGGYWYRQPVSESVTRFNIGDDADRIDTGETWSTVRFEFDDFDPSNVTREELNPRSIFSYSAEIDFEFVGDKTYWVSIYAVNPDDSVNVRQRDFVSDDFGIVLDYEGQNGELVQGVSPTGTQAQPFQNTNAVLLDSSIVPGVDPTRWAFSSTDVRAIFTLNQ